MDPRGALKGVEAIVEYFDGLGLFHSWAFTDFRAGRVGGGTAGSHVVEFHGSAIVSATSARYEQDYIVRFGLASDGLLQWMREYWDPTQL